MENDQSTSDSSDDDYVPCGEDALSEEEHSGDDEELPGSESEQDKQKKQHSKSRKTKQRRSKRNKTELTEDSKGSDEEDEIKDQSNSLQTEEEIKKKTDSLWESFLKDVGKPPAKKTTDSGNSITSTTTTSTSSTSTTSVQSNKKSIVKEYDFAGETIKVTKEVTEDELKQERKHAEKAETSAPSIKRPFGGLSNVLGKLNKKPKLSTLEKSKLDWESFKSSEGISDELKQYNRGKHGYLERQAFLERADLKQFEHERQLRLGKKS